MEIETFTFHHPPPHQVFINYRGDEMGYGFVSHLVDAFDRRGIKFFIDRGERRGMDLKDLFFRIDESRIALTIFSRKYAESPWCLDELAKINERGEMGKLQVFPIFYKVEAEDVKEQKGKFGKKFWRLARTSRGEQIMKWKNALESVSDKMGLSLGDKSFESDFIKKIVKEVERVLNSIPNDGKNHHSLDHTQKKRRLKPPYALYESLHCKRRNIKTC